MSHWSSHSRATRDGRERLNPWVGRDHLADEHVPEQVVREDAALLIARVAAVVTKLAEAMGVHRRGARLVGIGEY
jgi:hypothetical protein